MTNAIYRNIHKIEVIIFFCNIGQKIEYCLCALPDQAVGLEGILFRRKPARNREYNWHE